MFLEIHADTRRKTPYVYGLFRETFRQDGRVRHRTRGRVTGLTLAQLQALREFLKQGCPRGGIPALPGTASREYGAAVNCTISDGDVIEEVEERGCMRAQVRMERGGRLKGDLIFAIGTPRPH